VLELAARHEHRCRDVVFHVDFFTGHVVDPQLENAPGTIRSIADAQVPRANGAVVEFQFVSRFAIDVVDGEMLAPVIAPGFL
jgi:hypothetical protein